MSDERKIVWVLGAGFSAGVGGPLLQRLLSPTSENDIKVRYSNETVYPEVHSQTAFYVRSLYQHGLGHSYTVHNRPRTGEAMWTNAEEFIDYLDTAAEPPVSGSSNPHADRLNAIVVLDWNAVRP